MNWLRAEFAGLRPTKLAHNLAGAVLTIGSIGAFYFITGILFPWCAS